MTAPKENRANEIRTVLLPTNEQRIVGRDYIRELRDIEGSWRNLARALGYASSSTIITASAHPETITAKLVGRIRQYELKRSAMLGNYSYITLTKGQSAIPRHFRIAVEFKKCLGHQEWALMDSRSNGYCSQECKNLETARTERSRKRKK